MKTVVNFLLRAFTGSILLYCLSGCTPKIGGPLYTPNVGSWATSQVNQAIGQQFSQRQYRITSYIYTQQQFNRNVKDTRDAIQALSYHSLSKGAVYERQLEGFLSNLKARPIDWGNQYAAQDATTELNSIKSKALHTLQEHKTMTRN